MRARGTVSLAALLLAPAPLLGDWAVQVAMFADKDHVAEEASRLAKAGFPIATETYAAGTGRPLTRLLVGPYGDRTRAESAAAALTSLGWPGYLRRYNPSKAVPVVARPPEPPPEARVAAVQPPSAPSPSPPPAEPVLVEATAAPTRAPSASPRAEAPPRDPAFLKTAEVSATAADPSRLSEVARPLEKIPTRPHPLLEIGAPFLGTGPLPIGFTVPGGATWQPRFLTWGTLRSGIHDVELGSDSRRAAWVNRLDLFGQLNLTPTERFIVSFRPLDQNGQFSGVTFAPVRRSENDHFNATVRTLYFEGDFGEMFPTLDPRDKHALDWGFAVGRTPVFFQDGMLINDALDSVGIVRNSLRPSASFSNLRLTGLASWGNVNRGGDSQLDDSARLFGLFTEFDVPKSTVNADFVYVRAGAATGSGLYGGISAVQRIAGRINTTFRVLGSYALDRQTAAVGSGLLLYSAISWSPEASHDIIYVNLYGALKTFTPAARDAGLGGPLGNVGILFEGVGLGSGYPSVLPDVASRSYGGAVGYQTFLGHTRTQIIFELGARKGTLQPDDLAEGAFAVRVQQAIGRHLIARVEGFGHVRQSRTTQFGGRYELFLKF